MKYSKDDEKNILLTRYLDDKNFKFISVIINSLVESMDFLFKHYDNADIAFTLKTLLERNEGKIQDLISKSSMLWNRNNATEQNSIENLYKLLTGNINDMFQNLQFSNENMNNLSQVTQNIIKEYINGTLLKIEQERKNTVELLHQKSLEDAKAIQEGKRLDVKDQDTYKFLKDLQNKFSTHK